VAKAHLKGQKLGPLGKALSAALHNDPVTITCSVTSMGMPTEFGVVPEPLEAIHCCNTSITTAYTTLLGLDSDTQGTNYAALMKQTESSKTIVQDYLDAKRTCSTILLADSQAEQLQELKEAVVNMEKVAAILQDEPSASRRRALEGNLGEVVSGLTAAMIASTLVVHACMFSKFARMLAYLHALMLLCCRVDYAAMSGSEKVAGLVAEGHTATSIDQDANVEQLRAWWTANGVLTHQELSDQDVKELLRDTYAALLRCYRVRNLRVCNSMLDLWTVGEGINSPILEQGLTCGTVGPARQRVLVISHCAHRWTEHAWKLSTTP